MWGWDPSQGEGPAGGTTPTLVPKQSMPTPEPPPAEPLPVIVPDVQGLKQQFQNQQNLLAQIKETLRENDADRSSKEKQLEMYANKLSQIKSRSKNVQRKVGDPSSNSPSTKAMQRRSSKENLAGNLSRKASKENLAIPETSTKKPTPSKGKMNELKKRLEENKLKFEEQTEREITETKRIETMVEQLRTQVQERDATIHELQKSIDTPPSRPKVQTLPRRPKDKPAISSKWTQTNRVNEMTESELKVKELEATIVDLEDTIKQQASVITARTKAVTLLTEDLSKKGKTAVDDLELTRQEMKSMQNNFVTIEGQLKNEIVQKDNRLTELESKIQNLESLNSQLSQNYATVQNQLSDAIYKCLEKDSLLKQFQDGDQSNASGAVSDERIVDLEKKVKELTKELDDSNKLMIRLKLEHKNKLKATNKALEEVKKSSDDKGEIVRLSQKVEELQREKDKLESKIAELEEEKASEANLKQQITDLENILKQKEKEILSFEQLVAAYEADKYTWQQSIEDQNILVDNLNTRIKNLEVGNDESEPFEIPGEGAARQFDFSNDELRKQIEDLVHEKKELLDKLKNLPATSSTDSLTFEKVDMIGLEPEFQVTKDNLLSFAPTSNANETIAALTQSLDEEKIKSAEFSAKVNELEELITTLELAAGNAKSKSKIKNKFEKLERELFNTKKSLDEEKGKVQELAEKLEDKEKLIREYIEKMQDFEKEDDTTDFSELQRKCLSLENSLLELSEQCERLRKENIEVVHQLSEEKVRRVRAEEELVKNTSLVPVLQATASALEERIEALENAKDVNEFEEKLEYLNIIIAGKDTEIFNAQSALADRGQELDRLRESSQHIQNDLQQSQSEIKLLRSQIEKLETECQKKDQQIKDYTAESSKKIRDLEETCKIHLATLRNKTEECSKLSEDRHRLQVNIETVMADNAIAVQNKDAAEEKCSALERQMMEADCGWEQERRDWERFLHDNENKLIIERNEALLKADEAEKVLQKTWAERNELIQSKQELLMRLSDMEKTYSTLKLEKQQVDLYMSDLNRQLEEVGSSQSAVGTLTHELELRNKELEVKKEEYEILAKKAKKYAAHLKKKAQAEVELAEKIGVLETEKEALLNQLAAEKVVTEKWVTKSSEKEDFLREKQVIQEENARLLNENIELQQRFKDLAGEKADLEKETEAAFAEKCRLEEDYVTAKENLLKDIDNLKETKNLLNKELEDLKIEFDSYKQNHIKVIEDYKVLQQRLSAMEQSFELEGNENEALLSQKCALLNEKNELERKLEAIASENEMLIKKCKESDQKLSEIIEENKTLNIKVEEFKAVLQESESAAMSTKDKMNRILEQQYASITPLIEEKTALETKLKEIEADYEDQISKLQQSVADQEHSVQLLISEKTDLIAHSEVQLGELSSSLNHCKETINQLTIQLDERNSALNSEIQRSNHINEEIVNIRSLVEEKDCALQQLLEEKRMWDEGMKKKKKSVSFKTDDADYIKELKENIGRLEEELSTTREKVADLEQQLISSKMSAPIEEATAMRIDTSEVSQEKVFNAALMFGNSGDAFLPEHTDPSDPFAEESLTWDDGWGTDGHLEEAHAVSKAVPSADYEKMVKLECELKALVNEKEKADEEVRVMQVKYSKVVKKLKEQKILIDRLQGEVKLAKSGLGGDLDMAIMEELRDEIKRMELKEKETKKEIDSMKLEKESLLKRIDMLNAGNDRFLEMKEKQDGEVAIWQNKNANLQSEIASLQIQLDAPRPDDSELALENKDLRNLMEGLEWKISELTELVDEKDEEITRLASVGKNVSSNPAVQAQQKAQDASQEELHLQSALQTIEKLELELEEANKKLINFQSELELLRSSENALMGANEKLKLFEEESQSALKTATENISDLEQQLTLLVTENEELQRILNEQKLGSNKNIPCKDEETPSIFQYFQSSSGDFFEQTSAVASNQANKPDFEKECQELRHQLASKQQEVSMILTEKDFLDTQLTELKNLLRSKETEVQQLLNELQNEKISASEQNNTSYQENRRLEEVTQHAQIIEEQLKANAVTLYQERDALKNELLQKEEEIEFLKNQLVQNSSTLQAVDMLNKEHCIASDQLRDREDQVDYLTRQVEELQKAYDDSKLEIERLLKETKFRDHSPEDELASVARIIDSEKMKYEVLLKEKDSELLSLKDDLSSAEKELEDLQTKNENTVQHLKVQLRDLDSESGQALDQKDTELAELRAEVVELQDLIRVRDLEVENLRLELNSLNQLLEEETAQLPILRDLLAERDTEIRNLENYLEKLKNYISEQESELEKLRRTIAEGNKNDQEKAHELELLLKNKDEEIRDLRETLESVRGEITQFRNFDKRINEMQQTNVPQVQSLQRTGFDQSNWNAEEAVELAGRLQSDLDTALNMLHQRDVRCEELTFELMQLLEERDTLQLRLSTVIRTSEDLRSQLETQTRLPESCSSDSNLRNLSDKITELRSVSYSRDKNIQDESVQRHREQMALLNRDGRGQPRQVLDV